MGVDPGFGITGYGILRYHQNKFTPLDFGVIETSPKAKLSNRLLELNNRLEMLINTYKPDSVAIEELFFNKNIKTALAVGHGRGVAVLCAAKMGIEVFEYTPLQVKQAVAGYGRADKAQVQQMIKMILNLQTVPKPDDAADALAIAVCHAHSWKLAGL